MRAGLQGELEQLEAELQHYQQLQQKVQQSSFQRDLQRNLQVSSKGAGPRCRTRLPSNLSQPPLAQSCPPSSLLQAHGSPGAFWESEQQSLLFVIEMKTERVQEQSRKLQYMDSLVGVT